MPGVFSAINSKLQGNLVGKNLQSLAKDLPDGEVITQEGWVDSVGVPNTNVFIKGKYDLLVKNPDGTHTLVDLKISQPVEDKIEKYKTQLTAYKFALENPKSGKPVKVSRMGLLIFYPERATFENEIARVDFPPKWMEIPGDLDDFFEFMKQVDKLLAGPLPKESISCKWCQYRHVGENLSHDDNATQEDLPF